MEQTAKTWLTGGQKWLKSAGKKIATAAKDSASEIQKRLETADIKLSKGAYQLLSLTIMALSHASVIVPSLASIGTACRVGIHVVSNCVVPA